MLSVDRSYLCQGDFRRNLFFKYERLNNFSSTSVWCVNFRSIIPLSYNIFLNGPSNQICTKASVKKPHHIAVQIFAETSQGGRITNRALFLAQEGYQVKIPRTLASDCRKLARKLFLSTADESARFEWFRIPEIWFVGRNYNWYNDKSFLPAPKTTQYYIVHHWYLGLKQTWKKDERRV